MYGVRLCARCGGTLVHTGSEPYHHHPTFTNVLIHCNRFQLLFEPNFHMTRMSVGPGTNVVYTCLYLIFVLRLCQKHRERLSTISIELSFSLLVCQKFSENWREAHTPWLWVCYFHENLHKLYCGYERMMYLLSQRLCQCCKVGAYI